MGYNNCATETIQQGCDDLYVFTVFSASIVQEYFLGIFLTLCVCVENMIAVPKQVYIVYLLTYFA